MNNPAKEPLLPVTNSGQSSEIFLSVRLRHAPAARAPAEHKTEVKEVLRVEVEQVWERGPGKSPPKLPADTRHGFTVEWVADYFGVAESTLYREYSEALRKGRASSDIQQKRGALGPQGQIYYTWTEQVDFKSSIG